MARAEPLQSSFAAGELSPRLRGAVRSELYARGLAFCENWIPTPQGSLLSRGGTELVAELAADPSIKLIPFRTSTGIDYLLALTGAECRVYVLTGALKVGGTDAVVNGDFSAGTDWTLGDEGGIGSAMIWSGVLQLDSDREAVSDPPPPPLIYIYGWGTAYQDIVVAAGGTYTLGLVCTLPSGGSLDVEISNVAGTVTHFSGSATTSGTKSFDVALPAPDTYRLKLSGNGNVLGTITVDDVSLVAGEAAPAAIVTPWASADLEAIQYVQEPGEDRLFLVHPAFAPRQITFAAGVFSIAIVALTAPPASWAGSNWPGVCEMHQGRLVLAATPDQPATAWFSKSAAPANFTTGANPEDAFFRDLQTAGAIRWVRSATRLVFGTDVGETIVFSTGPVLREADVGARTHSQHGSAPVQALRIGPTVCFVSKDRRRIRSAVYRQDTDAIAAPDLTFQADHITSSIVKEMHSARDPDGLLVVVTRAGQAIGCSISLEREIVAWWRLTTAGVVKAAAVTETEEGSVVWLAVSRKNGIFLERMFASSYYHVRLDSQVTRTPDPVTHVIGDLADLEGEVVNVLVDGQLVKQDHTVVGGQIALTEETTGSVALVGIPFTCTARTLPRDVRDRMVRNVRVELRLNDSAIPMVNGWRAPERMTGTAWNEPTALATGKARTSQLGWDDEGVLEIVQDLPFRTEVLSIAAVVEG